jgi:anti-anti-sigma factor
VKPFTKADGDGEGEPPRFALDLQVAETGPGVFVNLSGDLDTETSQQLLAAISATLRARQVFQIDLHGVGFLDVAGARALVRIRDQVAAAGGSVRVRGLDYEMLPTARVLDLRRHLEGRAPGGPDSD